MWQEKDEPKETLTQEEITQRAHLKEHCLYCKGGGWTEIRSMLSNTRIDQGKPWRFILGVTRCQHSQDQQLYLRANFHRLQTVGHHPLSILIKRLERDGASVSLGSESD